MNTSKNFSFRRGFCGSTLLAFGFASLVAFVPTPALRADTGQSQAAADNLPSLPLSSSIVKLTGVEDAPYVLILKNESGAEIKADATVLLAVAFHAESKARTIAGHSIEPGEIWRITDLAKGDRVVVAAKGFAPVVISVE